MNFIINYFLILISLLLLIGCKRQEPQELSTNAPPGKWVQKAIFPEELRYGAFGFSLNNKIYLGGGHDRLYTYSYDTTYFFKDFWEYDPAVDKWTRKADLPIPKVLDIASFTINGKGYITTGVIGRITYSQLIYTDDLWEYDPSTDQWTQKASFPGPARAGNLSFSIGQKGYIAGWGQLPYLWEYDQV